jgi:hypothetical protein
MRFYQAAWMRKVVKLARGSGHQTLERACRTWWELDQYVTNQGQKMCNLPWIFLETFVDSHQAGTRASVALRWLVKNLRVQLPMACIDQLKRRNPQGRLGDAAGQAIVAEPVMLAALEVEMEKACKAKDPNWHGLYHSWILAMGVLRSRHTQRSRPVMLTAASCHFWCTKGKQRHARAGFSTTRMGCWWIILRLLEVPR